MIDEPTLFILGAGASKPYGFPTGRELKTQIIKSFSDDFKELLSTPPTLKSFERERELREAKSFVEHFSKSPVYSIDQFLALNPIFSHHGKMAITYYMCKREMESKFLEDMTSPFYEEDWYGLIFNRMVAGLKQSQDFQKFKENSIAFITFNYDRSLEYFLYTSFLNTFWQSRDEFRSKLTEFIQFPIIHVYGQVGEWGPLWEENLNHYRESGVNFNSIEGLSRQIHVIGEREVEDMKKQTIDMVPKYRRIFFCGFGYAKENLDVIGFPISIDGRLNIFGTAKGMTPKEIEGVRGSLVRDVSPNRSLTPYIEDKNTYDLLREYF